MANINKTLAGRAPAMGCPKAARASWNAFRILNGYAAGRKLLTQPGENLKMDKDDAVVIMGISLAQANTSGFANVCPYSTATCRDDCVAREGFGRYQQEGKNGKPSPRALKVKFLVEHTSEFLTLVAAEIDAAYAKFGDQLRIRLNTSSDIRYEEIAPWLIGDRPHVQFYDYTKDWQRTTPANYSLTLSASERTSDADVCSQLAKGRKVAVVFDTSRRRALPTTWNGSAVIDGDKSDNRADDATGVVIGLRAKGKMRHDTTGMVRSTK